MRIDGFRFGLGFFVGIAAGYFGARYLRKRSIV